MEKQHNLPPFPEGWTPRILEKLDLPCQKDIVLGKEEDAALVNKDLILSYRYLSRDGFTRSKNNILACRDRSKAIKIIKKGDEISIPQPQYKGTYGVVLLDEFEVWPRFYVGEDYRIDIKPRVEADRANEIIRLEISAVSDMKIIPIPGHLNFTAILTLINKPGFILE